MAKNSPTGITALRGTMYFSACTFHLHVHLHVYLLLICPDKNAIFLTK